MKGLKNSKKRIQKTLVAIILVLLLNFIVPNYSHAGLGGILMDPFVDFFCLVGDAFAAGMQAFLVDGSWGDGSTGGNGSFLNKFLLSAEQYNSNPDSYPEIAYNPNTDVTVKQFNSSDIDKALLDMFLDFISISDDSLKFGIPVTKYTPEKIFSGQVPALDINFINPKSWENDAMNKRSVSAQLHQTIATWYVSLRNLAIVGLMIVLVYVGIRMVISSTASDKAKYKQLLLDWLVAMCLLFCLHYIMSFTVTFTQTITDAIIGNDQNTNDIPVEVTTESGTVKFNTDLMGLARFQVQLKDGGAKMINMIIYLALVIYTVMFTFTYLKRVITMAFLTLMAPLVALTYPIDKINDGKAQAFNMWLKEYIFNALLQPFHLIIYMVFVGSAMELASNNPIYAIVALAFITPAEKILRKFFGFEKASTAGTLGAFSKMVGGAAAYKALGNAVNRSAKKSGGNNNVRTKDKKGYIEDPDSPSGLDGYTGKPREYQEGTPEDERTRIQKELDGENYTGRNQIPREEQEVTPEDERTRIQRELDNADYNDMYLNPEYYSERQARLDELERESTPQPSQAPNIRTQENRGAQTSQTPQPSQATPIRTKANRGAQTLPTQQSTTTTKPTTRVPQSPTSQRSQNEGRVDYTRREMRGLRGGIEGAGKAIKNKAATTLGNKQWRGKTVKSVLKTGAHAALRTGAALGVGALGVAAGIAGDDLEDVLTYGVGGAVLGATVGGNAVTNFADNMVGGIARSAPVQGFIEGATGKTSTQRELEKQRKELINDANFQKQIQQTYQPDGRELSGKELKEATARAAYLVNDGVDPSKMAKALKVEDDIRTELLDKTDMAKAQREELARTQAATAMKMADKIKDPTKLANPEYAETLVKNWTKTIQKKNEALTEKEARQNAEDMMKRVKKIHKIS